MPNTIVIELTLDSNGDLIPPPDTVIYSGDHLQWHCDGLRIGFRPYNKNAVHHPFTRDLPRNKFWKFIPRDAIQVNSDYEWRYSIHYRTAKGTFNIDPKITVRPNPTFTPAFFIISIVTLAALIIIGNYFKIFKLYKPLKYKSKLNGE